MVKNNGKHCKGRSPREGPTSRIWAPIKSAHESFALPPQKLSGTSTFPP